VRRSQEAVSGVGGAVSGSEQRLVGSIERRVDGLQGTARTAAHAGSDGAGEAAGVTLRQMMEVQRQFINTLDHRISRGDAAKSRKAVAPEQPRA
jgi:hypothetical protein